MEGLLTKNIVIKSWAELDTYSGSNTTFGTTLQMYNPAQYTDYDPAKHPNFTVGAVKVFIGHSNVPMQIIFTIKGLIYQRYYSVSSKKWMPFTEIKTDKTFAE